MRVVVGRIGRPHGIRGEVTVEPRTDEPEVRFAPGAVLLIDHPRKSLVVESLHWHSGRILLAFEGVETRNEAEELPMSSWKLSAVPTRLRRIRMSTTTVRSSTAPCTWLTAPPLAR